MTLKSKKNYTEIMYLNH